MSTKITVRNNGPILIEGDLEVFDAAGNKFELGGRNVISLCRCGQSGKKPFCDGTHGKCGFQSEAIAYALPPKV